MKWKEFLGDYFTFTRKERIGLLVIILIILGIWIFPKVSRSPRPETIARDTSWITAAKQLMTRTKDSNNQSDDLDDLANNRPLNEPSNESKGQLFYFDPNVLPLEGWKKLGIREKTITTIQSYLHKGGHFSKPRDLKKYMAFVLMNINVRTLHKDSDKQSGGTTDRSEN